MHAVLPPWDPAGQGEGKDTVPLQSCVGLSGWLGWDDSKGGFVEIMQDWKSPKLLHGEKGRGKRLCLLLAETLKGAK